MSTLPATVPGQGKRSLGVLTSTETSGGRFGALLFFSDGIVDPAVPPSRATRGMLVDLLPRGNYCLTAVV